MSSRTIMDDPADGPAYAGENRFTRKRAMSSWEPFLSCRPRTDLLAFPYTFFDRLSEKYLEKARHSISVDSTEYQDIFCLSPAKLAASAVLPVPARPEIRVAGN